MKYKGEVLVRSISTEQGTRCAVHHAAPNDRFIRYISWVRPVAQCVFFRNAPVRTPAFGVTFRRPEQERIVPYEPGGTLDFDEAAVGQRE